MKKRTIIIITVVVLILAGIAGSFQKNNSSDSNTALYGITWILKEKPNSNRSYPDKMLLNEDGTGECDSLSLTWKAENNVLSLTIGIKTLEYNYRFENNLLYLDNCAYANQLDLQANINLVGMTFYPDPKEYAEIYHLPDNPTLQITSISGDCGTIQLTDEYGNTYIGRSCDGWNNPNTWSQTAFDEGYVQYLFDNSQPFYGMTLHGFNNGQFFIAAQLKEHSNTFLDPMYNLK